MLPEPLRATLQTKLRAAGYGDLVAAAAWLTAQGHPIGRSSVGEYAKALKARDTEAGTSDPLLVLARYMAPSEVTGRLAEIERALGRLKVREAALLAEYRLLQKREPAS
jgi:hypothetical protein